ncbi:pickpocket [Culex quinquefasciatus]|uniref:Pickpocket n=1 Tax=Culex quinquefasciatus TaxID=7176 RepID=B0WHJ2_CULQU|nr:pickpocket [Culex quinquefasciatus]|eukprot:XP_001848176.1 pickpocket [Culex quinquefasciatus]
MMQMGFTTLVQMCQMGRGPPFDLALRLAGKGTAKGCRIWYLDVEDVLYIDVVLSGRPLMTLFSCIPATTALRLAGKGTAKGCRIWYLDVEDVLYIDVVLSGRPSMTLFSCIPALTSRAGITAAALDRGIECFLRSSVKSSALSMYDCGKLIDGMYRKWDENPVIVTFDKVTPVWAIPFPAVTICSETKVVWSKMNYVTLVQTLITSITW